MTTTTAPAPETTEAVEPLAVVTEFSRWDWDNGVTQTDYAVTIPGGFTVHVHERDDKDYDNAYTITGPDGTHVTDDETADESDGDCTVDDGTPCWGWLSDALAVVADDVTTAVIEHGKPGQVTHLGQIGLLGIVERAMWDTEDRYTAALSQFRVPDLRRAAAAAALGRELDDAAAVALLPAASAVLDAYRDSVRRAALPDLMLWGDLDARTEDERTPEYPTAYLAMLAVIAEDLTAPSVLAYDGRDGGHFAQAEADAAAEFMEAHGFVKPLQYPGDDDDVVTCDGCPATSETGWGDAPTCLACTPPENVCQTHQRTHDGTCHLCAADTEGTDA